MAVILDFSQYIGGSDSIQTEITFPSSQRTNVYNFGEDISGWSFFLDYQTVITNSITYDRVTGAPNFASSTIIGTFPSGTIDVTEYVNVIDATAGKVAITIPGGLYTGPIIPDARTHTPITIVGVTWTTSDTPPRIQTHRWALLQSWEPGVPPGDPVLDQNYSAVIVGA